MATPLSDEIRALITYANETTEAGDTKLGDCVKTLCEGYNGGKNVPSSPLVVPQGAISSRLAALLAYANETTGAGDTTMGDAIRTLCEGYGGGELIFYESIIGHKTNKPYIDTGFIPNNESGLYVDMTCMDGTDAVAVGCRNQANSNSRFFIGNTSYIYAGWNSTINLSGTVSSWNKRVQVSMNLLNSRAVKCEGAYEYNGSITADLAANTRNVYIGVNHNGTAPLGTYGSVAKIHRVKLSQGDAIVHDYVPCTYNGEAGMWDLVSQTFFGNAASSGQFTVEGEIVFYDYLQSDGAAYIETGIGVDTQTFICKAKQMNREYPVFGATSNFGYKGYGNNNYTRGYNFSSYIQVYSSGFSSKILEYKLDMTGFYVGTTKGAKARGTASGTLKLFSMTGAEYGYAKIYDMKILSVNDELLYHFLPCTCNGVAGMWDMVGWKFYGNSNTSGAFTAENDN